ncbi:3-keto-5-aminohexanoate cleavage enzyme [Pigmentiphaga humi]|uniref:3-keto-5-aminohexanoate cleavage enzyme n=1 Tax=Pigmentiphaga humi TaxID=2478468 RepID=A0A3P4AYX7_9BURK|nr:3-keto-5-aminohexanoate cleavage protein [Pigmentiphaga humi]VCU69237.1 3-keto-5-aminohexanoate cleavage enzyme [Pigmentiphaga humi]
MDRPTIITCAITGNHTTREQNERLPVTPGEIAAACLEAGEAGASIVHIHVRDPATGAPSMEVELYADVVRRVRESMPGLVLNLTTGPGGRFQPSSHDPVVPGPRTNFLVPEKRVEHIRIIRPDIATLDLNTMTFGREVVINTPDNIRRMAAVIRQAGVVPELELFDSGDMHLAADLIEDGTLEPAPLCSIVMGVRYGFQPSIETLIYARGLLPAGATWTAFATGRQAFPMVALAYLAGGNVRVGMEDAVYLSRGVLAQSNAEMVGKARRIVEELGGAVSNCRQTRERLGLSVAGIS